MQVVDPRALPGLPGELHGQDDKSVQQKSSTGMATADAHHHQHSQFSMLCLLALSCNGSGGSAGVWQSVSAFWPRTAPL